MSSPKMRRYLAASSSRLSKATLTERKRLLASGMRQIKEGARKLRSRLKEGEPLSLTAQICRMSRYGWYFQPYDNRMRVTNDDRGFKHTFKSQKTFLNWLSKQPEAHAREVQKEVADRIKHARAILDPIFEQP